MKQCKSCPEPAEAERYEWCYKCWWKQDPRNKGEDMKEEKDRDPRQPGERVPIGYGAPISLNNRLILEPYKTDRALRANVSSGFATVAQKDEVKGLKVLVEARIFEGAGRQTSMVIPRGSIAYIREEYLHTAAWAQKVLKADGIEGSFIIVDLQHVEFVKQA